MLSHSLFLYKMRLDFPLVTMTLNCEISEISRRYINNLPWHFTEIRFVCYKYLLPVKVSLRSFRIISERCTRWQAITSVTSTRRRKTFFYLLRQILIYKVKKALDIIAHQYLRSLYLPSACFMHGILADPQIFVDSVSAI